MQPIHRLVRRAAPVLAFAPLAGCTQETTGITGLDRAPQYAVTTNQREPFAFATTACNGELVDISGTSHHVVTLTTTPTGNQHVTDHITTRGTGVGLTTGTQYQLREVATRTHTVAGDLPEAFTLEIGGGLIGQGAADDFRFKLLFHFTVNAEGETTVEVGRVEILCK